MILLSFSQRRVACIIALLAVSVDKSLKRFDKHEKFDRPDSIIRSQYFQLH